VFRHYDVNENGVLSFPEFTEVLTAYGCLFKENEVLAIFSKYDRDGSGYLDYEEFSSFIALKGSGNNPNVNPVFAIQREKPNQVLDKILATLVKRGIYGVRQLAIQLRKMDLIGDRKLERKEFQWGMKMNGHELSPAEFERLYKFFD
jgi:hypothetical protein